MTSPSTQNDHDARTAVHVHEAAQDGGSARGGAGQRRFSRRAFGLGAAALGGVAVTGTVVQEVRRARMPTFDGANGWLNTEPLHPSDLDGRVVLVNFWTLTCINWLRTAAYVRAWANAYRDDGLVVVGVHTPEFSFEHDADLVQRAIEARRIEYPVALDNDYAIWNAFHNNYWPALYFATRDGDLAGHHFGEGDYAGSERKLQKLLGVRRPLARVEPVGVEADADWKNLRSPETYLGAGNGLDLGSQVADSGDPLLGVNTWRVRGQWSKSREEVTLDEAGGQIQYRFHARDAHLVLSSQTGGPIRFRVLLDGQPPGNSHGVDVDEAGNGVLAQGRLYQLVRGHTPICARTLTITFDGLGAQAYAFTFG